MWSLASVLKSEPRILLFFHTLKADWWRPCFYSFLAAQARARGNFKVRSCVLLSALTGETFIDAYDMVPAFLFAAWNCGQAFFRTFHCYISFVNLSRGQGTYYTKDCERFSLFLDAGWYLASSKENFPLKAARVAQRWFLCFCSQLIPAGRTRHISAQTSNKICTVWRQGLYLCSQ